MPQPEISFDLVMKPDMGFVEGTFRLTGGEWQVFVFKRGDVAEPQCRPSRWDSGVSGLVVTYPRVAVLNRASVERVLSSALAVQSWFLVRGPDSMQLR
jgi:hypothetical protein